MLKIEPESLRPSGDREAHSESDLPDRFREVLDFVPEAVLEVDAEGRIVFANAKTEEVFGYPPAELLNRAVEILIPIEIQAHHAERRAAYSELPKNREMGSSLKFAGLRKDGARFAADVALSPIRSEDSRASHILAFVRDVTHLRRLEIAERELLDRTLLGLVTPFNDLIGLTCPLVFERIQSIRMLVDHMLKASSCPEVWRYQLAAALCLLGCAAVPPDIFEKFWSGANLSREEEQIFQTHPAIGERLISHIPRLEEVAEIVGNQLGTARTTTEPIRFGIALLQLAQQADRLMYRNVPLPSIVQQLRLGNRRYREDLLESLATYTPPPGRHEIKSMRTADLRVGMILEEDLSTDRGLLIAPRGGVVNPITIERIKNFSQTAGVRENIRVRCSA